MQQKPVIYVRRITNLSDARYCAGMGVDMLGFVIDPGDVDYVSPSRYQEMIGWIAGPKRALEIPENVQIDFDEVLGQYKPDLLNVSITTIRRDDLPTLPLILNLSFNELSSYHSLEPRIKANIGYLLINDFPVNASALPLVLQDAPPIMLSLRRDQSQVLQLMNHTGAKGFALQGSRELAPGLKDYDHLSAILDELEG